MKSVARAGLSRENELLIFVVKLATKAASLMAKNIKDARGRLFAVVSGCDQGGAARGLFAGEGVHGDSAGGVCDLGGDSAGFG